MMLNIKHKFATLALLLVLAAPFAQASGAMLDFGWGGSMERCGNGTNGGC